MSKKREGVPLLGIYGAGGFGREVLEIGQDGLRAAHGTSAKLHFIDDVVPQREVNGAPVLRFDEFRRLPASRKLFSVAVANSQSRAMLVDKCLAAGMEPYTIVAPGVSVSKHSEIGEGAILCHFSTVTANSRIGRYFHGNLYCYVAHDCEIGDFVTFAPSVKCNGWVVIEDSAFVGTGAILSAGRKHAPLVIGRGATIGAGAVVMRNVPPGVTVIGNPARAFPSAD
jgi:hypothetical protein